MWLFVAFVAVPLIEIALFIQIGGLIGLWPTLLIVVLTALLGTQLVRSQGAAALAQLRGSFEELRDPTEPLAHGAMILFSGALLLTPGFFTDAVGFALLAPAVRRALMRFAHKRVNFHHMHYGATRPPNGQTHRADGPTSSPRDEADVVDAEFEDIETAKRPTHKPSGSPSGWTRH